MESLSKEDIKDAEISRLWCDDEFDFKFLKAMGRSGGKYALDDSICSVLNVYAPCEVYEQISLWNAIVEVRRKNNNKWFMAGDFNAIRNHSERSECSYRQTQIAAFNDEAKKLEKRINELDRKGDNIGLDDGEREEVSHKRIQDAQGFKTGRSIVPIFVYNDNRGSPFIVKRSYQRGLSNVKQILRCFEMGSGLSINLRKSCLAGVKVEENNLNQLALLCGCTVSTLPFKYLGISLGADPRKISTWDPVIEKFRVKLVGWKSRMLSFAGRVVLINSVLSLLPLYYMSIFLVPKSVVSKIDKIRRGFLWGYDGNKKRLPRVNWGRLCNPRKRGGTGIIYLKVKNKALLVKWGWRFAVERGALWRSVICHKYDSGDLSWLVSKGGIKNASITWRGIVSNLYGDGTSKWMSGESFRWIVGDGKTTLFREDVRFGEMTLRSRYPRLYKLVSRKYMSVWEMLNANDWQNRIVWVHENDELFKVKKLSELLLSDGNFEVVGLNIQTVDEVFEFGYQCRWSGSIALAWFMRAFAWCKALKEFTDLDEKCWWDRPAKSAVVYQSSKIIWKPPVLGQMKFNVDGSATNKSAGCGGVLRIADGYVVVMFSGPITEVNSDYAELVAIKIALEVFVESCWCGKAILIIESDSKVVLNWVQNFYVRPWRWGAVFQEIDANVLKIPKSKFVFSPRTSNNMADYLANMGLSRKIMFKASW
ncbi:hypothetical protein F3Y22_tig00111000pilonHSYRG00058 [Hibiscus syriacus]|uniref:RNase H type-1 domain-containing protein n=1 Tax=Hibiscus syriacus TaxID=106335 RepID=A0A6A2ZAH6_HIBSY|nr:hypothetical protein F3Y22_tig00111000pilonHSYRG00058 [Hibiscus syriacus]